MTDLEKAIAEFAAKNGVTECPPVADKQSYASARRESFHAQKERLRANANAERAMHNAENKRYDNEGVFYIGGYQEME